jgi:hypothetical protein
MENYGKICETEKKEMKKWNNYIVLYSVQWEY